MSESDDPDMLAAEYVLGTLDAAERGAVAARLAADATLGRAVAAWEERLSPLLDAAEPVSPPPELYGAIEARLFGAPAEDLAVVVLRRRLRLWRGAAGGLALLAASLAGWVTLREIAPRDLASPSGGDRLTAVLQRDAGAPAMVVEVDLRSRRLTIRPAAPAAPAGRAYELWIIDPALGTPRSLGVVPDGGAGRESLGAYGDAVITGATYAVTVEEAGGSRTGQPTSAPILTGKLSPART